MSDSDLEIFCRQVRDRSSENKRAISLLYQNSLPGNMMSILRQELDSMVRCIFLRSIEDQSYRQALIHDAISGKQWRAPDGKRKITDREMVDISSHLHGWTRNVYSFGCAFIHLSNYHDYSNRDPFLSVSSDEKQKILHYLGYYHGFHTERTLTFNDIIPLLPAVFEKILANLECVLADLEKNPPCAIFD